MRQNTNARTGAATLERARETASGNLQDNLTTYNDGRQDFLVMILPHGEENAISAANLKKQLGLSDKRVLRKMVERSRVDGAVILSSDSGYFLPSDDPLEAEKELKHFLRMRDKCLITNRAVTRSARQAYERLSQSLSGQMVISEAVNGKAENPTVSEEII